jgi:dehydrogenase/reductase SDR family protein 12
MGIRDTLLDLSVAWSFDQTGYLRHARGFDTRDLQVDLAHHTVVVTGANSGIGRAAASQLGSLGAHVVLACRDPGRGEEARAALSALGHRGSYSLELLDVGDLDSVTALARRLNGPIHALIHNAGTAPPTRQQSRQGFELQWATHVLGPTLLTQLWLPQLSKGKGRVITMSSGGMYTARLHLEDVAWEHRGYQKLAVYAHAKRAQVTLNETWARRHPGVVFHAAHPGWVDTPLVAQEMPAFHAALKDRLRTPDQGADTAVWLAASSTGGQHSGTFWFDRKPAPVAVLPATRATPAQAMALWDLCQAQLARHV